MEITSGKYSQRLHALLPATEAEQALLSMVGLPILDGVFAAAVVGNALATPAAAVSVGMAVFSGPSALAAVFALRGSFLERGGAILRIYAFVAVCGVLPTVALAPLLRAVLLPNIALFSALVLLALALQFVCCTLSPTGRGMPGAAARSVLGLARTFRPQVVLVTAVGASLLNVVQNWGAVYPALQSALAAPSGEAVAQALVAYVAGLGLTISGLLFATVLQGRLNAVWTGRGGAAALVCIAMLVLGLPLPPQAPLLVFGMGLLAGAFLPDASRAV